MENTRELANNTVRSPEQFPIEDNAPKNFVPLQVIYREIIIEADGSYRYMGIDKPTLIPQGSNFKIEEFTKNIVANGYKRNDPDHEEYKFLAITVSKPSYIIIELSDQLSRKYSIDEPGITLGKRILTHPDPDEIYGELRHVDEGGNISPKALANCRLAYFSAMPVLGSKKQPYVRSLNYNTEDRGGTLVIIDPDVRHPGNGSA